MNLFRFLFSKNNKKDQYLEDTKEMLKKDIDKFENNSKQTIQELKAFKYKRIYEHNTICPKCRSTNIIEHIVNINKNQLGYSEPDYVCICNDCKHEWVKKHPFKFDRRVYYYICIRNFIRNVERYVLEQPLHNYEIIEYKLFKKSFNNLNVQSFIPILEHIYEDVKINSVYEMIQQIKQLRKDHTGKFDEFLCNEFKMVVHCPSAEIGKQS